MARVTVEDCIQRVPNRFDLVMLAAQRAREISAGSSLTVERDNDKNPVVALREIADQKVSVHGLEQSMIQGLQRRVDFDEFEEDEDAMELLETEIQVAGVEHPEAPQEEEESSDAEMRADADQGEDEDEDEGSADDLEDDDDVAEEEL